MRAELKIFTMELIILGSNNFRLFFFLHYDIIQVAAFSFFKFSISSLLFVNFRTACVIAVAKARDTFEPFLHQVISLIQLLHLLHFILFYIVSYI